MSSNSSSTFDFPSPVGGVPFASDFAPSVLFAVLYGLLVPVMACRMAFKHSRNIVITGTFAFAVERIVIFALRAEQARNPHKRVSDSLTQYMQLTFGMGYVSIVVDLIALVRCVLVRATEGKSQSQFPEKHIEDPETATFLRTPNASANSLKQVNLEMQERARERFWYRRTCGAIVITLWVPFVLAVVAGLNYVKSETDAPTGESVQQLRYASSALTSALLLILDFFCVKWAFTVKNVRRGPVLLIAGLAFLLNIITIYRLVIMDNWTTSLTSTALGSQNTTAEKALFYVFQVAPEWITAAVIISINTPKTFGTGFWGDGFWDQKPKTENASDQEWWGKRLVKKVQWSK